VTGKRGAYPVHSLSARVLLIVLAGCGLVLVCTLLDPSSLGPSPLGSLSPARRHWDCRHQTRRRWLVVVGTVVDGLVVTGMVVTSIVVAGSVVIGIVFAVSKVRLAVFVPLVFLMALSVSVLMQQSVQSPVFLLPVQHSVVRIRQDAISESPTAEPPTTCRVLRARNVSGMECLGHGMSRAWIVLGQRFEPTLAMYFLKGCPSSTRYSHTFTSASFRASRVGWLGRL